MNSRANGRRLLLVHAHPDDESIGTGATMARYAAEGAQVTLVTCTLGELGEVIPPELADLARDGARLGAHRITELAAACAALGITGQRFLGGPGRWRDSGMMGLPENDSPGCFWQADVAEAAAELAVILREVRPQVLVTYDENGFYGHPDHIQAHRVAREAVRLAAGQGQLRPGDHAPPWQVAKFYVTAMPRSVAQARGLPPVWVPDEQVTTEIDGTAYLAAKITAMRAHATQIAVKGASFALADGRWQPVLAREYYTLLARGDDPPELPAGPGPRSSVTAPRPLARGSTPLLRGHAPGPPGPGTPRGPARPPFPLHGAGPASRQAPSRELAGPAGTGPREDDLFAGLDGR